MEELSACCKHVCSINCLRTCCKKICPCNCLSGANKADSLKIEEVSAADYIGEKRKELKAQLTEDNLTKSTLRSCGGFTGGVMLAVLYAGIVLFVKNYNLWFCIVSSVVFACFLCLGMAFSMAVRMNVLLTLPLLFSSEGKAIVLMLAFGLTMQGPGANTIENFLRCTKSVSCGVELALNQTKELLEKVKQPLLRALDSLKKIGKKLKGATDKAKRFYKTIMVAAKHIGRSLRKVWRFIASIGEVCNEELEGPYIKCNKLFDNAKDKCFKVMSFLGFLCYILDVFKPLCGLARIILIFCLLPYYVQRFVKKNIKNPFVNMVRNIKDTLDFNITVNHRFDVTLNSSKSSIDVVVDIMKDVNRSINPYLDVLSMFSYTMTIVCIYLYIMAARYRTKYLYEDNHDNIYITREFIQLDVMRAKTGRSTLLPLTPWEAYKFIRPHSLTLTRREKQGYSFSIMNIFRNVLIVTALILIDYYIFWVLDMVRYHLQEDVVARAPATISVSVNGSGVITEMFSNVVSAFDTLQSGNVTVVSKTCLIRPSEPDFRGYLGIGAMYGLAFFIAIFGVYVRRLRRSICAYYHPSREQERICFLYNNLSTQRLNIEMALIKSVKMNSEDAGHKHMLYVLAAKIPAFYWLLQLLGSTQQYCMACAMVVTGSKGLDYLPCITPGCKGLYCKKCFGLMNNVCSICMAPLAYSEAMDEEIDSSDEDAVLMHIEAMKILKAAEKEKRKKMKAFVKARLRQILQNQKEESTRSHELVKKYRAVAKKGASSSESSEAEISEESGETDYEYQDKSEDSDQSDAELPSVCSCCKKFEDRDKSDAELTSICSCSKPMKGQEPIDLVSILK